MSAFLRNTMLLLALSATLIARGPTSDAADGELSLDGPLVLGEETPASESGGETILEDGVVVESAPALEGVVTETVESPSVSVLDEGAVVAPDILDVGVGAVDGMRIDEFGVDEMPYEASSGRWFWNGGWYVGGESLWMDRSRTGRVRVAVDVQQNPRLVERYTTMSQPFNVAPGARATIGKSLGRDYLDRDRFVEFIYYGGMSFDDVDGWNAYNGENSIFTPLDPVAPGFNAASRFVTKMNSDINSWEWNYKLRRRLGRDQLVLSPGGNWTRHAERGWLPALIVGTRLANVNEDLTLLSSRPGTPASAFSGDYTINAANWLLGLNVGGELLSQNEFYYWGLRGRAAPALTFANTSQLATGVNTTTIGPTGTTSFSDAASQTTAGFIGDLTLFAGWQVTPNFSLQAGYDFLWIAGMATANRQYNLANRDNNQIDSGGQTFYNGVSFGFYGSW